MSSQICGLILQGRIKPDEVKLPIVVSIIWVALFGVLYYGLFPVLFVAQHFKKYLVTGPILGFLLFINLVVFSSDGATGPVYSLFLLTAFLLPAVILLLSVSRNISYLNTFYLCQIPSVLLVIYFTFRPLEQEVIFALINPILDKISEGNANQGGAAVPIASIQNLMTNLISVFWYLDLSIRLIIGSAILSKIQRSRKINLQIPPLREVKYPDWPIWLVITGLLGMFVSLYFSEFKESAIPWISATILLIMAPLYFLRGLSVVFAKFSRKKTNRPWPTYLKIFIILLILWAGPTLIMVSILFGIIDTWIDFRSRNTEQPIER